MYQLRLWWSRPRNRNKVLGPTAILSLILGGQLGLWWGVPLLLMGGCLVAYIYSLGYEACLDDYDTWKDK